MTSTQDGVETMVFMYNRGGRSYVTPSRMVANWRSHDGEYFEVIHTKSNEDENS